MLDPKFYVFSKEVQEAIDNNLPIVALESTVIAHGLPYPQNLETAQSLERIVRTEDAVPATIAILKGKFHIGLDSDQLEYLAQNRVHKISKRDLPIVIAKEWDGATTVATTIWVAKQAGIKVFATGGIGGVHRGQLPDISADLPELAETPIIVLCSGAKIILDLPATREWLETYGITLIGYGCDEMPAFYSRSSGLPVDIRVDNAEELAEIARVKRELGTAGALLVTVPVPEEFEVPSQALQEILDRALEEANHSKIQGRELTPFLLSYMSKVSSGATLRANIALLENNARIAAELAKCMKIKG
jgi:pseudouridylate synthase